MTERQRRRRQGVVNSFNSTFPIGTPVRYWVWAREGEGATGKTRSKAWLCSGTPVVLVEGNTGGIALTHIEVLPEAPHVR